MRKQRPEEGTGKPQPRTAGDHEDLSSESLDTLSPSRTFLKTTSRTAATNTGYALTLATKRIATTANCVEQTVPTRLNFPFILSSVKK